MRKVITGVLLLALGAIVGVVGAEWLRRGEGPRVAVLLRDSDGLRVGNDVTRDGSVIGQVEGVSAEGSRVRVAIRLDPALRTGLTRSSTFRVEHNDDDQRRLEAYVLDDHAPELRDGDTVEGVTSNLELTLRKAALKATRLIGQAAESEWVQDNARKIDRLITEIESTDWNSVGRAVDGQMDRLGDEMRALATRTRIEAEAAYLRLEPELQRLVSELDAAGKSEEARALRRRIEDLLRNEPVTPEAPLPPPTETRK